MTSFDVVRLQVNDDDDATRSSISNLDRRTRRARGGTTTKQRGRTGGGGGRRVVAGRGAQNGKYGRKTGKMTANHDSSAEVWRIYGIDVDPDSLARGTSSSTTSSSSSSLPPDRAYLTPPVLSALLSRLRISPDEYSSAPLLPPQLIDARVVRRSIDARRRGGCDPKYSYVIDVTIAKGMADAARDMNLMHRPGRTERVSVAERREEERGGNDRMADGTAPDDDAIIGPATSNENATTNVDDVVDGRPRIIIVGAGPAGLFCALSLASTGKFVPILLERGMPVESRGKSIGALIHRREIDTESNFSFGEGGAGKEEGLFTNSCTPERSMPSLFNKSRCIVCLCVFPIQTF
jgi:hypothetical protein